MTSEIVESLRREITSIPVGDDQAFLEWLPLAARLAALGDREQLSGWSERFGKLNPRPDIEELVRERVIEGIDELFELEGDDLAFAVIAAQDFYIFSRLQESILPDAVKRDIKAWSNAAGDVLLDAEAHATLEEWLEMFPIPEDLQIDGVACAMSRLDALIAAANAPTYEQLEFRWDRVGRVEAEARELIAMLDDESPSAQLRDAWDRSFEHVFEDGLAVRVQASLSERWQVAVDFEPPEEVDLVRLGLAAGRRDASDVSRWLIDLGKLSAQARGDALAAPLVICLRSLRRIVLEAE